jgi:hypothetical protein
MIIRDSGFGIVRRQTGELFVMNLDSKYKRILKDASSGQRSFGFGSSIMK